MVPPYCGAPRLSHQFPVAVVVVGAVVVTVVLARVVVVVMVVAVVLVVVVVDVDDVEHDASNIVATKRKFKPNQINLFFNFYSLSNYLPQFFHFALMISSYVR
jgi:hypothetical protein